MNTKIAHIKQSLETFIKNHASFSIDYQLVPASVGDFVYHRFFITSTYHCFDLTEIHAISNFATSLSLSFLVAKHNDDVSLLLSYLEVKTNDKG